MASFQKTSIDFSRTKSFPQIAVDYVSGNSFLKIFYEYEPEADMFQHTISNRAKFPVDRKIISDVLTNQHVDAAFNAKVNVALLKEENTFTVTTGHQLNIFGGPLYFIYKIISAINLACELKLQFPSCNFVPVYWMASEDHDLAEINNINLFGKKIEWKTEQKGAAGKISCAGLEKVIDEIKILLGETEEAKKIISLFTKAYAAGNTLGAATRIFVNELFGNDGLVIIDADDTQLKSLFADVMIDDLVNHTSYKQINESIKKLETKYKVQVNPREINLFYLKDNLRERIIHDGKKYSVNNSAIHFSEAGIIAEVKNHPEWFSPNVVLRAMYQEKILPNIAYIGGPAEIAYWLEYKSAFEQNKIFFPTLMLRSCAMIVDKNSAIRMEKLGISSERLFDSADELKRKYVAQNSSENISLQSEVDVTAKIYDVLLSKINSIDASLNATIEAEKQKQLNSLKMLEEKIIRAQKKKHETALNQIDKLSEKFFPEGNLQEREENFISMYLKYGDSFFDLLKINFHPFEKKFLFFLEQ